VPERRSFYYVRHGTVDLFAALNIATGKVIGKLSAQHRAVDFRDFLDQIDRQTDPGLAVHVICDNLSAHKAPAVHRWLLAHPRFVLHFTPTYSSWINQVERWFAELQRRCLERGVFCSLDELTTALEDWIKLWNEAARPFTWTKTADQIIEAVRRASKGEVLIPVELFARAIARQRGVVSRKREHEKLLAEFTPRELDIMNLLAEGLDTGAMSLRLGIAPHTVEWHVRHVIEKLQVHSKLQAVISAARKGLIQL